jgi:hypothetical protein
MRDLICIDLHKPNDPAAPAMQSSNSKANKSFGLAIAVSLLLHAAVLFIKLSSPPATSGSASNPGSVVRPGLFATILKPAVPGAPAVPAPQRQAAPAEAPPKTANPWVKQSEQALNTQSSTWANRSWTSAQKSEMDKFLKELAPPSKPPSGSELSQQALAMAQQLGRSAPDQGTTEAEAPAAKGKPVEPFSLEMYFDAFVRKMNRSAAFVKNDARGHGSRKALVEISLNPDGSLKDYRVLRSADQQAEIAYIKAVVDRAAPFSAFPPDIRSGTEALSILMCIMPSRSGEGGGFSRSFGGQDCRD